MFSLTRKPLNKSPAASDFQDCQSPSWARHWIRWCCPVDVLFKGMELAGMKDHWFLLWRFGVPCNLWHEYHGVKTFRATGLQQSISRYCECETWFANGEPKMLETVGLGKICTYKIVTVQKRYILQTRRESSKTFETKVPDTIYREQELMFVLLILFLPWSSIFSLWPH